ncbi:MAG: CaiB/BaiF CoA-transferase family protein [Myxococcota bacterium]
MGTLDGIKVVEIAGIGPGPFCGMMLSDMGADVLRIDRADRVTAVPRDRPNMDLLSRGRGSVAADLKNPEGVETVLRLIERADVLIEGFRPGVTERLGIGPDVCLTRNPRLVYGRMTGWGQDGPLAQAAGHDINYISLAGALHGIGRAGERPVPPLNLVGDFGGGGMLLAFGVVCALVERDRSGQGQVVDAAMVDGAATLMTIIHGLRHMGLWTDKRGENLLDTGAHFYDVYETADGEFISIGAIEPQFYAELLKRLDLDATDLPGQMDQWPDQKERFEKLFRSRTRDEWCSLLEGTDVCFAPVLSIPEAYNHPHNRERGTFVEVEGTLQPAPAPRFSRTPGQIQGPPTRPGERTDETLARWGFEPAEIAELRGKGAIA